SSNGHMTVHTYLPVTFQNGTTGLLGRYSLETFDDFMAPSPAPNIPGRQVAIQSPPEVIHREFGMQWRVVEGVDKKGVGTSLFFHNAIRFAEYDDQNFRPEVANPPRLPEKLA